MARRTNYKQEKRAKELDKIKKKEAKKERKLQREASAPDEPENQLEPEQLAVDDQGEENNADN